MNPRWYCIAADGPATLCVDEEDAREVARDADRDYPKQAPHLAVLLGDVRAERERCAAVCDAIFTDAMHDYCGKDGPLHVNPYRDGCAVSAVKCSLAIRALGDDA